MTLPAIVSRLKDHSEKPDQAQTNASPGSMASTSQPGKCAQSGALSLTNRQQIRPKARNKRPGKRATNPYSVLVETIHIRILLSTETHLSGDEQLRLGHPSSLRGPPSVANKGRAGD
ncbi:hypothetical protein BaRGS_00007516 [Batillaria attramentaria]|uniref:Uncharacterized protein n=1 Tax=Batillaria attramentaria TaxID=370345 RepID=A0ABD0LQF3_9CAEN